MIVKTVVAVDRVIGMLGRHTRLGVDELAELPELTLHEREALVRTIEGVPGFIAAFESSDVWKGDGKSELIAAPPPPPRNEAPLVKQYPVVLKLGEREYSYQLLGIGATHCMVTGKNAVPENLLMELKVACDPPLRGYASVKLAWPEHGGWTLLVQPFGLTEGAQSRWKLLGAEHEKAA
jgi:hypothetical protein